MEYITEYKSENYFIGATFINRFNVSATIIGKAKPPEGKKYTSKFIVRFEDSSLKAVASDMLAKGSFAFPIIFSRGNNSTNRYKTIYKRFEQMKLRCNNPSNKDYVRYGGRGITCEFDNVYQYWFVLCKDPRIENLLDNPEKYEIDRIDNDKGYSKTNIRVATKSENQRNRRDNFMYNLINNKDNLIIFTGIKKDCENYLKDTLGINTAIDTKTYKKEVGKRKGYSIRYELV